MKPLPSFLQLKLLLLCVCALGCQTADEQVGSACPNGVCPQTTAVQDGLACVVSTVTWEIAVQPDDELQKLCLPSRILSSGTGQVPCQLRVLGRLLAVGVEQCSDRPFLEGGPYDHERSVGGPFCNVRQLAAGLRGEGGEEGWYYSEFDDCPRVDVTPAVKSFVLENDLPISLSCATAWVPDPEGRHTSVDPDLCGDPISVSTGDVGAACMPSVIPEAGFDPREAYFEPRSEQCQTGGCLVYALEGDPSSECAPPAICPSAMEIERSVYCSCRCDAPEGDTGPLCDCPDGFACVEAIGPGPRGIEGGYCVRNHSVSG
jgi:hypothetical protein